MTNAPPQQDKNMLSIADYEVHPTELERWGNDAELVSRLNATDNKALADRVFKYLNRPLPEGVKPDDLVDVSAATPSLLTIEQLAEKAGVTLEECQERIADSLFKETDRNGGTPEKPLYYWQTLGNVLVEPRLSVNNLAERYGLDRRTVKKHLSDAVRTKEIMPPKIKTEGNREYLLYWLTEAEMILNDECRIDPELLDTGEWKKC